MKFAFLTLLFMFSTAHAFTSDDLLHPVAHMGASYMITHGTDVVCRKVSKLSKLTCSLIGASVAMTAGVLVEASQDESRTRHITGILENSAGILLAIGVINYDF